MSESFLPRDARLALLLRMQLRGRLRRSWQRLSSPRRLIPTLLVGVFLLLYVVQIYIAIALNPSRTTVDMTTYAPLGMLCILGIKLLGIGIDRKKSGAGYRNVEVHQLLGGPFSIQQVRLYRVSGHALSIFFTAVFAAIFFRFHVPSFPAALLGAYLAMLFTYLIHSLIAVVAANVPEPSYRRARNLLCALAVMLLGYCLVRVAQRNVTNLEFLRALGDEALLLCHSPAGRLLTAPFQVFTHIVVASELAQVILWLAPGVGLNWLALHLLLRTEAALERQAWQRERADFGRCPAVAGGRRTASVAARATLISRIPWVGGAGPIIWRQVKSVIRVRSGLSWLLIPLGAALAVGCYAAYDPEEGAFMTIAVTVVLSSVFLPGLLPFDFRGDLQGLSALKMMPIRTRFVVLGQLAVPVAILCLFQLTALAMLIVHDRSLLGTISLTMCFLIPTNTIILALENLIFLLYPYRLAEFDMQATVRRIVMLMAKFCVIFLAALIAIVAGLGALGIKLAFQWIPAIGESYAGIHATVLVCTQLAALSAVAAMVVWSTWWAYERFDLSEDLPL